MGLSTEGKHASLLHSCHSPVHPTWQPLEVWKSIMCVIAVTELIFQGFYLNAALKQIKALIACTRQAQS